MLKLIVRREEEISNEEIAKTILFYHDIVNDVKMMIDDMLFYKYDITNGYDREEILKGVTNKDCIEILKALAEMLNNREPKCEF